MMQRFDLPVNGSQGILSSVSSSAYLSLFPLCVPCDLGQGTPTIGAGAQNVIKIAFLPILGIVNFDRLFAGLAESLIGC